ncbi:molybdenum cofactor guanylyltransferase [Sphingomonas lutea]|uniref:Molybdenum cofactor guanylyltransferase n=1 Tax=Sphingomonas lutea TaxID=1045317 RepID=A0A7G9SGA4_9SPHN|nr:molybdenum cofactor guanylyltransferase [Sphingomonas lutea]QNN66879.1 molybdenum cofactor guanylyltransferase [Sphingomonas lutea]
MRIAVVILAGGQGRRIGGNKPLRVLAGRTLLNRAVEQARQWSGLVFVAVRDRPQAAGTESFSILDEPGIEGPLAGLAAALREAKALGCDGLLTIPADMPFLPTDLPGRLASAVSGHQAAIAASGGHLHPVCGLWPTSALQYVPGYLSTGNRSLRGFAEAVGYVVVEWPADPADPFFNINAAEDLAAAEQRLR